MLRILTAIAAAAIAAVVMLGNLAPADARAGGPGPSAGGGAHPPMVQHFTMGGMANPCPLSACRSGGRGIGGPVGAVGPHPAPVTQHPMTGNWNHECGNDPDCHHHHHHHDHDNFASFYYDNGPYYTYQPEPDCWVWSHRLHRWIWACGPSYPSYY